MTTTTHQTHGVLRIENPTEHISHCYETASAYDKFILQPGIYDFRLVNINYTPWVPGSIAAGYTMPTGPYYAMATVDAVLVERYYENRLLGHTSARKTSTNEITTYTVQMYAHELGTRRTWGTIGRIMVPNDARYDTYRCIADLSLPEYLAVLGMAVQWLDKRGHGDYSEQPHWHVWNRINAQALGGIEGYVKAVLKR